MNDLNIPERSVHIDSYPLKHWEIDNVGNLRFIAPIARKGNLIYLNDAGEEYPEYVPETTLVNSLDSFKTKAVTLLHPPVKVSPKNSMQYQRGLSGYTGFYDGNFLWLTGTATDQELIDSITSGKTKEISPGYDALVKKDSRQLVQAAREGNHLAAVPRGRNGRNVRFRVDSVDGNENSFETTYYLKEEFDADDLGDAPEQLYENYRDPTKPKIFTFRHVDQQLEKTIESTTKTRLNVRSLIVHKLI